MKHILQRHHPDFWDGSLKSKQTFLNPKMTIDNISEAVHEVMKQNRELIIQKGTSKPYQITGTYRGQEYTVGLNAGGDAGRIGQFFANPPK